MNPVDELIGFSILMQRSTEPQMQVVGYRLADIAATFLKPELCDNPAPTPAAVLLKDMADWWGVNRNKPFSLELHAEISKLAYRAHCIVHS